MHERLFGSSRSLDEESLPRLAAEAGLDVARWQKARAGAAAALARDEAVASTLGVLATPTFFVNGRRIEGAQTIDLFQQTIDEELAKAESLTTRGVRPEDVYATLMKDAVEKGPPAKIAAAAPGAAAPGAPAAAAPARAGCEAPGADCGCAGHDAEDLDPGRVEEVPVGASPVRGPQRAPVTVVVFSDFQCPFCQRSEATLRALVEQYGTRVRLVFKNHPLPMHPSARAAARAALAAGEQGKFWEYHDVLFAHIDALDPASLERYARDLGLDVERFRRTMGDARTDAAIDADEAEATRLGVAGTPTFFVNGRRLIGAQPLVKFQAATELALADGR
jgi:protein-disulfide isomerase